MPAYLHSVIQNALAYTASSPPVAAVTLQHCLTYPMPQLSQHVSRSWADISTLTLALLWTQILSDMASAAPNACKENEDAQNLSKNTKCINNKSKVVLQPPERRPHPTWTARTLVSDLFKSGAVGPLLSGIKVSGELDVISILYSG